MNESESSSDWEEDLDELLLLKKGEAAIKPPASAQAKLDSYKKVQFPQDPPLTLLIKSTPEGRMVRWEETGLHHQSAEVHSLQIDKLPFQEGTSLAPSEYEHTQDIKDLCREVLLVHISEIQEADDDSLDRVNPS